MAKRFTAPPALKECAKTLQDAARGLDPTSEDAELMIGWIIGLGQEVANGLAHEHRKDAEGLEWRYLADVADEAQDHYYEKIREDREDADGDEDEDDEDADEDADEDE